MSTPSNAVFLSYASEDGQAAQRIADALRAAGIEVWFDKTELGGGDAWDRSIRQRIRECQLFVPVISAHSDARREGYFRREWKLAVDRTHDMSERVAFLVPVVIDDTSDSQADVPDRFREVQWTHLPGGEASPAFVERMKRLLSRAPAAPAPLKDADSSVVPARRESVDTSARSRLTGLVVIAVIGAASLGYWALDRFWISKHMVSPPVASASPTTTTPTAAAAFAPPPHSIAVLPFVNMSEDKEQEYFSDGLTEELLNSLSRIGELQVSARTSSFSFQGEHPDIATVAHKLNVGAVLEGSVRRSAHTIRITAQLVNGVTGFHLWSQTYDRDLGDFLALQTEIANAVASALKVTLLGNVAAKIELGGTHNPGAFDAYLRASKAYINRHEAKDVQTAIAAYSEAIRLDPNYARAFVARSIAFDELAGWWTPDQASTIEASHQAQADARKAIALAPELGEGHFALGEAFTYELDFTRASEEYERAMALAPGNAQVLQYYGLFAVLMGRTDTGIAAARRAVLLDPLNRDSYGALGQTLTNAHHYEEALAAFREASLLDPNYYFARRWDAYYGLGNYQDARALCEVRPDDWGSQVCLAMTYDKLGRHPEAESELAKFKAGNPKHNDWYLYAEIYAEWGDTGKALSCLEAALRERDVALEYLKTEASFDPLRKDPRFKAIERALKFPAQ
jgi:TolB-like protein/Flp pilus assembly protein TadD